MWITLCILGVVVIGGITSCVTKSDAPISSCCQLAFVIGLGYFLYKFFG